MPKIDAKASPRKIRKEIIKNLSYSNKVEKAGQIDSEKIAKVAAFDSPEERMQRAADQKDMQPLRPPVDNEGLRELRSNTGQVARVNWKANVRAFGNILTKQR